jgi:DNA-binding NarL/FixJ family response regulator
MEVIRAMSPADVLQENEHIRLAIVCSQPIISRGLEYIFQEDRCLTVLKEIPSLSGLPEMLSALSPEVTLIDWDLVADSLEARAIIRAASRHTHCLLLMHMPGPRDCRLALEIGARGTLAKSSSSSTFRRAVWRVYKRGIWVDPAATDAVLEYALSPGSPLQADHRKTGRLTPREKQIVELVCEGYRNKKIAAELNIAETTVCHHLTSVFSKLEVDDRLSLMAFAHRNRLRIHQSDGEAHRAQTEDILPRALTRAQMRDETFPIRFDN